MSFYESFGAEVNRWALTSMYNYLYSVKSLVSVNDYESFCRSRKSTYLSKNKKQLIINNADKKFLFEQFFFAYKLMNNIKHLSELEEDKRVSALQLCIMAFYYASYSFAACFIYMKYKNLLSHHSATYKSYGTICDTLSFPFDMTGRYNNPRFEESNFVIIKGNSEFSEDFSYDSNVLTREGLEGFNYKSGVYSYLMGTHRFYWDEQYKENALKSAKKEGFNDFRSKRAKEIRDEMFEKVPDSNYLSCLYRLRGKNNYRDSLFSLYALKNMGFNIYEKAIKLPEIMLEILKYFSLDIESLLIVKLQSNQFHENMINDIILKTSDFSLTFPQFQNTLLYP